MFKYLCAFDILSIFFWPRIPHDIGFGWVRTFYESISNKNALSSLLEKRSKTHVWGRGLERTSFLIWKPIGKQSSRIPRSLWLGLQKWTAKSHVRLEKSYSHLRVNSTLRAWLSARTATDEPFSNTLTTSLPVLDHTISFTSFRSLRFRDRIPSIVAITRQPINLKEL